MILNMLPQSNILSFQRDLVFYKEIKLHLFAAIHDESKYYS